MAPAARTAAARATAARDAGLERMRSWTIAAAGVSLGAVGLIAAGVAHAAVPGRHATTTPTVSGTRDGGTGQLTPVDPPGPAYQPPVAVSGGS